jgi:hypothetical protein
MEQNMRYVYNNLDLSVYIDSSGYLEKQIGWRNNPLPINFNLFKKPVWKTCLLDSTQTITMASMANAIADSIVASNVLLKED